MFTFVFVMPAFSRNCFLYLISVSLPLFFISAPVSSFLFRFKISLFYLSREPRKRRPNALQVPLPRRLSWPCVSDLQSIYKAESWQRAVTLNDSTPQCRLCENRYGVSTSLLLSRHHRQVKLAVKT
jgi:hypothetical protein